MPEFLLITSKYNKLFKFLKHLTNPHIRKKHKAFLIEGFVFVKDAMNSNLKITSIIIDAIIKENKKIKELLKLAYKKNIPVYLFSTNLIKEISCTDTPQGVIAIVKEPEKPNIESFLKKSSGIILILDSVQDPTNVGAIIRTADAAGVSAVFYTKGTADPFSQKAVRCSAGSILHVPVAPVNSLKDLIIKLKTNNFKVFGTVAENGINLFNIKFPEKVALILGNEARGISEEAKNMIDQNLNIPMFGKTQSLNVAVATGIILYEILHQRLYIAKSKFKGS